MTHHFRSLFIALALTTPLAAAEFQALRAEATITGEIVRLGDLIDGAGAQAGVPLFRAPDLGKIGTISAARVAEAAREYGVSAVDMRGLTAITIRRPARDIGAEDIAGLLSEALSAKDAAFDGARLKLDAVPQNIRVDQGETAKPMVEFEALDARSGKFTARVSLGASRQMITGTADTTVTIPVLLSPVGRGDAIRASDIGTRSVPRRDLPLNAVTDAKSLVGQVARRALPTGQTLREGDIARPDLVERNQAVTVTYETPGLTLTLRGRALAAGPAGAVVPVQNPASKRTIEAIVTGQGRVTARLDGKNL